MSIYTILADLIAFFHLGYVAFVVVGEALILLGALVGWAWVRNLWFRVAHLVAILLVGLEAVLGVTCPLTIWERNLRLMAGEPVSEASFVGRLVDVLLFYDLPQWVFPIMHIGFAVLVIATYVFIPPRRKRREAP